MNRESINSDQLTEFDQSNGEILIVSCDWLLWQKLTFEGWHVVYYELGNIEWQGTDALATDLFNSANDWILDINGEDPTIFRGVSLGRLFGGEMTMALVNYHRLSRSLKTLISKFSPEEIWFYDFKYEINHLNIDLRRKLVSSITEKFGLKLIDTKNNKGLTTADNKNVSVQRHIEHSPIRLVLGTIYSLAIEVSFLFCSIFSLSRPKVLLLVGQDLAEVFARGYRFKETAHTPIFFGRTIRRQFKLIFHCFKNRMLLVNSWKIHISRSDASQIQRIYSSIEYLISTPGSEL